MMIIVVAGNIASGKSSLARALSPLAPRGGKTDFKVLGIDDFRNVYRNESIAQAKMLGEFCRHENIIYETTTCNRIHREVMDLVLKREMACLYIRIVCPLELCKLRFEARKEKAYFAYQFDIEKSLVYIENQLKYYQADLLFDSSLMSIDEMVREVLEFVNVK